MTKSKLALILTFLLSQISCTQLTHNTDLEPSISLRANEVIYTGYLSEQANQRFYELVKKNARTIDTLNITSKGGDILLAMDLGDFIFKNQLNVKVPNYCLSSCANYVFPSGKTKYLTQHSVIGFHGGANSTEFDLGDLDSLGEEEKKIILVQLQKYMQQARVREINFYRKLAISPKITTLGQEPQYLKFAKEGYQGWYYDLATLQKLGVKNINLLDGTWSYQPINAEIRLFPITTIDSLKNVHKI